MPSSPSRALLYGGLLLHTVLSAGSYLSGKSALREIPPLPLGMLRFVGASMLLVPMLLRVRPPGHRLPPRSAWPRLLLLAFVVVPVSQGFFLTGLALSTAAHAALLYPCSRTCSRWRRPCSPISSWASTSRRSSSPAQWW